MARPRRPARNRRRPRFAARSTVKPSAPQSRRARAAAGRRPGHRASAMRIVGLALCRTAGAASASSAGAPVAERRRQPRRARAGAGMPSSPGSSNGRARREFGNAQRGDERVAIDRLAQQAGGSRARRAGRRHAAAPARTGPRRDRSAGSARQLDALREGQVGEGAAKHQVGLARRESAATAASALAPLEQPTSSRCVTSSSADAISRVSRTRRAVVARRRANGPGADAVAEDRQLGLGEQRQQIGARRDQPDLDHPVGHCDDVVDRAERVLERILAAARRFARLSSRATCWAVILRPSGHFGRGDAENVAQPVVADVPALGEPGDDVAAGIEPDEALRDVLREAPHPGRRAGLRRVAQCCGWPPITTTLTAPPAAGGTPPAPPPARKEAAMQEAPHRCGFSRNRPFSKHLDISVELFY